MVKLNNVSKIYHYKKSNAFQALNKVSLTIQEGELVAIMGKSGSGKTTLLNILGCIDSFEGGSYLFDGTDVSKLSTTKKAKLRSEKIGIVMQEFSLVEAYTSIQNVMLPIYFGKTDLTKGKKKALLALQAVGMEEMANKHVSKLSGGQKQRVAIARAIVNRPRLVIADEPTGALDSKTSSEIMALFLELHQKGHTIVIVTHDPNISEQCERIIHIEDGMIVQEC